MPYEIRCPPVIGIGWVPARPVFATLPDGFRAYAVRGLRAWVGIRGLFLTGNPPPPAAFFGPRHFGDFLAGREYRSALRLSDVALRCGDDGRPVGITCRYMQSEKNIGFTPVPVLRHFTPPLFLRLTYHPGIGDVTPPLRAVGGSAGRLVQVVRFRIGRLGNATGRAMIGHWAPDAWMALTYEVDAAGAFRVNLESSGIPSEFVYLGGALRDSRDMLTLSDGEVTGFLEAGHGNLAPGVHRISLSGTGVRVEL